ncbi:MAG: DMT family protein [Cytophagaceae bacterium]|nr:DMT family protein [Cytophagaceae bacterium]
MKITLTIIFLLISNAFMTLAWYGHLYYFKKFSWVTTLGLFGVILISWGVAFFEYVFQVPANKIGFDGNGGPFSLFELKIIQEVISLTVFSIFAIYIFKTDKLAWNYIVGFAFMVLAVFFIFKKW